MHPKAARQALADLPLFATLEGPEELSDILGLARPFEAPAGTVLFRQGKEADGLYVLTAGEVTIQARIPGDTHRELGRLGPGAMLGEIALIDRGPRSAGAEARSDVAGWFLSERLFRILRVARRPSARKVMERICVVVCERIRGRAADLARAGPPPPPPWSLAVRGAPSQSVTAPPPDTLDPSWLERLPFFARFPVADRAALLACGKLSAAPRGQLLWTAGEPPLRCYVPVRGALRLLVERDGRAEPYGVLGPGQLVGDVALLDGLPQPSACEVCESAWLFEAGVEQLHRLATGTSNLSLELFDAIAASLVEHLRVVTRAVARLSAQGRIRPTP